MFHRITPEQASLFQLAFMAEMKGKAQEPVSWAFNLEEVGIYVAKSWALGFDKINIIRGLTNDGIESPVIAASSSRESTLNVNGIGGLGVGLPTTPF